MKEQYLSKTPFLTFVYISKCNINLPEYFGNSKKVFVNRSSGYVVYVYLLLSLYFFTDLQDNAPHLVHNIHCLSEVLEEIFK